MTDSRGSGGRSPGAGFAGRLLDAARAAGCREAELFIKISRIRQIALEPPLHREGVAQVAVSRLIEAGVGLGVTAADGRAGLAWRGGGGSLIEGADEAAIAALLDEALAAARAGGPHPREGVDDAGSAATTGCGDRAHDAAAGLDLVDPECLERPEAGLAALADAVVAEVEAAGEQAVEIDRVVVTEARTAVRLARLSGFDGAYERTIAALSIALVPIAAGAEAVTEERNACRLEDLDAATAAREAIQRALPPRAAGRPVPGAETGAGASRASDPGPRVVLAPRAAASLIAALAPRLAAGAVSSSRPSALSVVDDGAAPGRPGSAPFDGSGRPTGRRLLLDRGRTAGRITPETGPWQRLSYRDLPAAGPACLMIVPGLRRDRRGDAPAGGRTTPEGGAPIPVVRAATIEIRTGVTWVVQIRRGEWESGEPADGLYWEGTPAALVRAVAETGDDSRWYEVGLAVAAPTVVLEGPGPWRLPGEDR